MAGPKFIKLAQPSVSLNAPNIHFKLEMKYTRMVPNDMNAQEILEKKVPDGVKHVVFNCHGFVSTPNFGAPHLAMGTVFHMGNVAAFEVLKSHRELGVIWLSACSLGASAEGLEFCKEIARRSSCSVVTSTLAVPDRKGKMNCIEDYSYSMPQYIDPWGDMVPRGLFFGAEYSTAMGFSSPM